MSHPRVRRQSGTWSSPTFSAGLPAGSPQLRRRGRTYSGTSLSHTLGGREVWCAQQLGSTSATELLGGAEVLRSDEDELHIQHDLDLLADENAAALDRDVPGQAEVLAVDLSGGLEAGAGAAPWVGADATEVQVEAGRLRDSLDGQQALESVVADLGRLKGHDRIAVNIEEVGGLHVRVSVRAVGVDGGHLHGSLDCRQIERLGNRDDRGKVLELAADLAHHEVASRETDLAVGGIDVPDAGLEVRKVAHVNAP